jgi:hypothetical protein
MTAWPEGIPERFGPGPGDTRRTGYRCLPVQGMDGTGSGAAENQEKRLIFHE